MKKLPVIKTVSVMLCLVLFALGGCQKTNDNSQSQEQTAAPMDNTHAADVANVNEIKNDTHDHSEHAHHDHHDHHHDNDQHFMCHDKAVFVGIHEFEGETEAHATIDDIAYDFYPDTNNPQHFISQDGIHGKAMLMILADNKVSFYDYNNQQGELIFECQKVNA